MRTLNSFTASVFALVLAVQLNAQDHPPVLVKIQIDPQITISHISTNFIGFGYETAAVAQSNFFTPSNLEMVQLYRNLGPGLIRIGGIISDHTKYVPDGQPAPHDQKQITIINRHNLGDLGDFARATGWKVMWGLNLGTGTKEEAVEEAQAVNVALGSSLQSFQIGNEVEGLRRFNKSYDAYHTTFIDYKNAIRAVLPDAPFSGPDSIGNITWVTNFASTEAADTKILTVHYYCGGAGDPKSTLEKLLARDEGLENRLNRLRAISREHNIPFRINEVNSYSGGGKAGVSDTFGAALWCLDFMYRLASYGCDGVNMETDINQLGWISHYSPIVHDPTGHCSARPEYYGMLAFATAAKGDLVQVTTDNTNIDLAAYATKDAHGLLWLTIINKDASQDATLHPIPPRDCTLGKLYRLKAPSIQSNEHVTFSGALVTEDGKWSPTSPLDAIINGFILVPHASAAVLSLDP
jgi:hypothetical protein